jgi:ATP-dependent Clp protease ATP-binding subunit ClpC
MEPPILQKFTNNLKTALKRAGEVARSAAQRYINPEHLLYAILEQRGSIGFEILQKTGVKAAYFAAAVGAEGESPSPGPEPLDLSSLKFSLPAKKALERAVLLANSYKHKYVGTEHLLSSILDLNDPVVGRVLDEHHVLISEIRRELQTVLKSTSKFPDLSNFFDRGARDAEVETEEAGKTSGKGSALEFFATDLTSEAMQKRIDPVIGRAREIERLIHILSRRTKNNPVLIGDPGVGKTAIVEGLAKRIVAGDVPDVLLNKRILALDLGLMVAGTMYRGEFESRVKQVLEEIKADANLVLFIDELHTIVGAGSASGSLDAANMLKPALAKGQIRVIGATTLEEYKKHIESDAALERRFQPIVVEEPTAEETLKILKGIKQNYETFHRITIGNDALEAAVKLSSRYIPEKFLPDKAIDLIDEAASKLKVELRTDGHGKELRELERRVEELALKKQKAVAAENFERALQFKNEEETLRRKLAGLTSEDAAEGAPMLGAIGPREIAAVVSRITGVPLAELLREERNRLLHLEAVLKKRIIGQEEAVAAVANYIRRSRVGLHNPNRPLASFIFLGPTGVGKTELAKTIAAEVFEDPGALIRIDMSEFAEAFNVSKLIGAPAGYVGYKDSNKLTDQVRRKPYSVILFDEIEKAHPDIFNVFLQVLEDGQLTDAAGKTINFKNTIIIMTSNVGLANLNRAAAIGFEEEIRGGSPEQAEADFKEVKENVLQELKRTFRPEFLNRIDQIVVFNPLGPTDLVQIAQLQLKEVTERLHQQGLNIAFSKSLAAHVAQRGADPDQGARGIRKVIQEEIENPLASKLLSGGRGRGTIRVGVSKGRVTITRGPSKSKAK